MYQAGSAGEKQPDTPPCALPCSGRNWPAALRPLCPPPAHHCPAQQSPRQLCSARRTCVHNSAGLDVLLILLPLLNRDLGSRQKQGQQGVNAEQLHLGRWLAPQALPAAAKGNGAPQVRRPPTHMTCPPTHPHLVFGQVLIRLKPLHRLLCQVAVGLLRARAGDPERGGYVRLSAPQSGGPRQGRRRFQTSSRPLPTPNPKQQPAQQSLLTIGCCNSMHFLPPHS